MTSAQIRTTCAILEAGLRDAREPAIMASFGKDSMVAIDLAVKAGVRDVIYLPDPDEHIDDEHVMRVVDKYKLTVHRRPGGRALLYFIDNAPMLVSFPFVSAQDMLPVPTNLDAYDGGSDFVCVDDRLRAEHGEAIDRATDVLIFGQKLSDLDANSCRIFVDKLPADAWREYKRKLETLGPIYSITPRVMAIAPLFYWTNADVWEYTERECVSVSTRMYDGHTKRTKFSPTCVRCHDPRLLARVTCPKTGAHIANLAHFTREPYDLERLVRIGVMQPSERAALEHNYAN